MVHLLLVDSDVSLWHKGTKTRKRPMWIKISFLRTIWDKIASIHVLNSFIYSTRKYLSCCLWPVWMSFFFPIITGCEIQSCSFSDVELGFYGAMWASVVQTYYTATFHSRKLILVDISTLLLSNVNSGCSRFGRQTLLWDQTTTMHVSNGFIPFTTIGFMIYICF